MELLPHNTHNFQLYFRHCQRYQHFVCMLIWLLLRDLSLDKNLSWQVAQPSIMSSLNSTTYKITSTFLCNSFPGVFPCCTCIFTCNVLHYPKVCKCHLHHQNIGFHFHRSQNHDGSHNNLQIMNYSNPWSLFFQLCQSGVHTKTQNPPFSNALGLFWCRYKFSPHVHHISWFLGQSLKFLLVFKQMCSWFLYSRRYKDHLLWVFPQW